MIDVASTGLVIYRLQRISLSFHSWLKDIGGSKADSSSTYLYSFSLQNAIFSYPFLDLAITVERSSWVFLGKTDGDAVFSEKKVSVENG